ncbi:unnamed protein product [Blepharisma stoltei]|uniref:Uncharacterized protein n=1 Tax=Blepharisma stoltei TaxID=1481888 RepID=A0AAU9JW19_9CILI|nr:unnamed protein product [Blepharisma stoltei]
MKLKQSVCLVVKRAFRFGEDFLRVKFCFSSEGFPVPARWLCMLCLHIVFIFETIGVPCRGNYNLIDLIFRLSEPHQKIQEDAFWFGLKAFALWRKRI